MGNVTASLLQTAVTSYLFFYIQFHNRSRTQGLTMNNEYPVFLRKDEWEDVIDFMACMAFDIERTDELRAYAIQLIEAIKEQINES